MTIREEELKYLDVALRVLPELIRERFKGSSEYPGPFRHMSHISTGEERMQILVRHKPVVTFDFDLKPFDVNSIFEDKSTPTPFPP